MPNNLWLRAKWEERGLNPKAGSAVAALPPLGGFRRLYHLTDANYAISNIAFDRLKVARFSQLNDLFELLAPDLRNKNVRRIVRAHRERLDGEQGLLCFSADWVIPPLWAHYGNRHRGVCLGFDVAERNVLDVKYQQARLKLANDISKIPPRVANQLARIKAKSWRYERESRVLVPLAEAFTEGEAYFKRFDSNLVLAEVILGALCPLDVNEVREFVGQRHTGVSVFQARPAIRSFGMVPNGLTVLEMHPY